MAKRFRVPREISVNASQFGVVGDGVTDDTAAIQAALDRTGQLLDEYQSQGFSGPATCRLAGGTYIITSTLTVRNGTSLKGDTVDPPYPNEFSGFGSNQNKYTGTQITCMEPFTGDVAINLEADNTSLEGIILEGVNLDCGTTYTQIKVRNTAENRNSGNFWHKFNVSTPIDGPNPDFRQQAFEIWNKEVPYFLEGQYMEYQLSVIGGEGPFEFRLQNETEIAANPSITWTGDTITGPANWNTSIEIGEVLITIGDGFDSHRVIAKPDNMTVQLHKNVDNAGSNQIIRVLPAGRLLNGIGFSREGLFYGTAEGSTGDKPVQTVFPGLTVTDSRVSPGPRTFSRTFTLRNVHNQIESQNINDPTATEASFSFFLKTRHPQQSNLRWWAKGLPEFMELDELTGELRNSRATTNADVSIFNWKAYLYSINEAQPLDSADWQIIEVKDFRSELRFADGGIRVVAPSENRFTADVAQSFSFYANGGYGDFTWSINDTRTNSEFPGNTTTTTPTSPYAGITLNTATGEFTGTATTPGRNEVFVRVESNVDPQIFYEAKYFFICRNPGDIGEMLTRSLPSATLGQPFSYEYKVNSDLGAPYKFEAVGLPTGLSMDPDTGIISGTPTGASYVDGVRIQWSCSVRNCTIRGFRSGGGITSRGPSNVHRLRNLMICICDSGFRSVNQTYDSHFEEWYVFNCRTGLSFGPGTAGNTFSNSRIEFVHEYGLSAQTSHENDFGQLYFDTCGWSSIRLVDCRNNLFVGNRSFRAGRNIRGTGTMRNSLADLEYSNHMYLEDCEAITITGNIFDAGTQSEGNRLFLQSNNPHECVRPYTGIRMKNCRGMNIVGNGMEGVVNLAMSADLGTFGRNEYLGFHADLNAQSDREFVPLDASLHDKKVYVANGNFRIWQRDTDFLIPFQPSTPSSISSFPVADCWILTRGGNESIQNDITVSKGTDAPIGFGTYISIQKANDIGQPNTQVLELSNNKSTGVKWLNGRTACVSFWAKSPNSNTIRLRVNQYNDTFFNGSKPVYSTTFNDFILTPTWKRYSGYVEFGNTDEALEPGPGAALTFTYFLPIKSEDYDVQLTGLQLDFVDVSPVPTDTHYKSYEYEKAFCQQFYQHSKRWEEGEFLRSWSDNYRYDTNGADWGPNYRTAWFESTVPGEYTSWIQFDNPVVDMPVASTAGGNLTGFKILATDHIDQQNHPDKYKIKQGTKYIDVYHENSSANGVEISCRLAGTNPDAQTPGFYHWIYTTYSQDTNAGGGYD